MLRKSVYGIGPLLTEVINALPASYYLNAQDARLITPSVPRLNYYASSFAYGLGCSTSVATAASRYVTHVLHTYRRVLATVGAQTCPSEQHVKTASVMSGACACMSALLNRANSTYQCGTNLCPICRAVKTAQVLAYVQERRVKEVSVPLRVMDGATDVSRRYRPPAGTTVTLRTLVKEPGGYVSTNYAFGATRGYTFTSVAPFVAAAGIPGWLLTDALADPSATMEGWVALQLVGMHATARALPRVHWDYATAVLRRFPELHPNSDSDGDKAWTDFLLPVESESGGVASEVPDI